MSSERKEQLLQSYYIALPKRGIRLDDDLISFPSIPKSYAPKDPSLKLHEVLENVILELKNKDRRRRELKLRNSLGGNICNGARGSFKYAQT